jgi:DNA-binding response OmpR family regulator
MRILVIEDEARITEILEEALSRAGFAVDSASRCGEAREALSLAAYDAAVLALGLPDGDGRALLADLQASRKIPVLVLTARDAVEDRVSGLDAGADDYLVKPFATAEVIARVRALLRRRAVRWA